MAGEGKLFLEPLDRLVWQNASIDLVAISKSIPAEIALKLIKQIDWDQGNPDFTKACYEFFQEEIKDDYTDGN